MRAQSFLNASCSHHDTALIVVIKADSGLPRLFIEYWGPRRKRGEIIDPCQSSNAGIDIGALGCEGIAFRSKGATLRVGRSGGARTIRLIRKGRNGTERIVGDWWERGGIAGVSIGIVVESEATVHRVKIRKTALIGTIQRCRILVNDCPVFHSDRGYLSQGLRDSRPRISLWIRTLNRTVGLDAPCPTNESTGTFLTNGAGSAARLSHSRQLIGICILF